MSDFPQTIYGIESEPYVISATAPRWDIGQRMELPDARIYRSIKNDSTGLESQVLVQGKVEATMDALAIQTSLAVGDRSIKLTNATTFLSLNEAKGGYVAVWTQVSAGAPTEAQQFRIWSNNLTESGGVTTATLVLWPGLKVLEVVTIASGVGSIIVNPYSEVVVAPAGVTAPVVGVTLVDVTASYYGWVQTNGVCAVKVDDSVTMVVGNKCDPGTTDAGSIADTDSAVLTLVGFSLQAGIGDDNAFVYLGLD